MDPFSITTAAIGLISSIASLSTTLGPFVKRVRDSRKDVDAVSRELSSLSLCVENLKDDVTNPDIKYPPTLIASLVAVLKECDSTVLQLTNLINNLSSESVSTRIRWAANGQAEVNGLRSRLEAHKSTIDIALEVITIKVLAAVDEKTTAIKHDTTGIKQKTTEIKQDTNRIHEHTSQLIAEIAALKTRLEEAERLKEYDGREYILQRFLDQSTSYAETVTDQSETSALNNQSDASDTKNGTSHPSNKSNESSIISESGPPPDPLREDEDFEDNSHEEGRGSIADSLISAVIHQVSGTMVEKPILIWPIPEKVRSQYNSRFQKFDTDHDGRFKAKWVDSAFGGSGLPEAELTTIWQLTDTGVKGFLTIDEFAVALHLILGRRAGCELPKKLFPEPLALPKSEIEADEEPVQMVAPSLRAYITSEHGHLPTLEGWSLNRDLHNHIKDLEYPDRVEQALGDASFVQRLTDLLDRGADMRVIVRFNFDLRVTMNAILTKIISRKEEMTELVDLILRRSSNILKIIVGRERPVLHEALLWGHKNVINLFLLAGMDVNVLDPKDGTALHMAAAMHRYDMILFLIAVGANVNARGGVFGGILHTVVSRAWDAPENQLHVCRTLLAEGADIDMRAGIDDVTALHIASSEGNLSVVRLLCEGGAQVDAFNRLGETPLLHAIQKPTKASLDVIRFLLSRDANVLDSYTEGLLHDLQRTEHAAQAEMKGNIRLMLEKLMLIYEYRADHRDVIWKHHPEYSKMFAEILNERQIGKQRSKP